MAIGSFKLPTSPTNNWTQEYWQSIYNNSYTRPSDWLTLPTVNIGDEKIVILHTVYNHDSNFCAFTVTGSNGYTVDWGDGIIENIASGVKANHLYDFNYSGFSGTTTTLGYKQSIVTITPQAGGNLLTANFNVLHNSIPSSTSIYSTGFLDFRAAGINFTSILFSQQFPQNVNSSNLQMFEFIGSNNITSIAFMFNNCYDLRKIVSLDTSKVTFSQGMFQKCYSLPTIPLFDFTSLLDITDFFSGCGSLITVPFLNLSAVTSCQQMFSSCSNLINLPLFNFASLTTCTGMFRNIYSLKTIPLFDLSKVTSTDSMFFGSQNLSTVPLFDLRSVTNTTSMFQGCSTLSSVPLFNLSSATNTTAMFSSCISLSGVPLFDLHSVTNASSMFNNCSSLKNIPNFTFNSLLTVDNMFQNCYSLPIIPAYNFSSVTSASLFAQNCYSHSKFLPTGMKGSVDFTKNKLSKQALELIFSNLGSNVTGKTVTITSNYGADGAISKTTCGTVSGSTIITQSNTSSLSVGMRVSGAGIDVARAVTLQPSASTITLVAHGIPNNKLVYLSTLVTTTGITAKTPYYVVSATTDTLQLSSTSGGTAITLTGSNGTGTLYFGSYITSINPNISFTIDVPANATGSVTLTARILDTSSAVGKGWTVTG